MSECNECAKTDDDLTKKELLGRKTLRSTELPQVQTFSRRFKSYQALPAYVREWTLARRTYDDLGRHTAPDTSAPMDIGQVKGMKGKKKEKGKEKGKSKKDNSEAKGSAQDRRFLLCRRVWVLWQMETPEGPVQEAGERPRR